MSFLSWSHLVGGGSLAVNQLDTRKRLIISIWVVLRIGLRFEIVRILANAPILATVRNALGLSMTRDPYQSYSAKFLLRVKKQRIQPTNISLTAAFPQSFVFSYTPTLFVYILSTSSDNYVTVGTLYLVATMIIPFLISVSRSLAVHV